MRYLPAAVTLTVLLGLLPACNRDKGLEITRVRDTPERLAPLPVGRTELAGAAFEDGTIVVAGGFLADGSVSAQVDLYDREENRWRKGPPLPEPRHHPAMAAARGRIWLAGGFADVDGAWKEMATVWSLGPGERSWRTEAPLRESRGAHALVATSDGTLVAFGGTSNGQVLTSNETLARGAKEWAAGPPMLEQREHLAGMFHRGRVYAIAGRVGSFETNRATVESLAVGDTAWREEPRLVKERGGTAAAGGCVAGGEETEGTIGPVECLRKGMWATVADLERPRHGLAVVAVGDELHVIGGGEQPGLSVSTAHEVLREVLGLAQ